MNERRVLNLVLEDPKPLSPAMAVRWDTVVKGASKHDVASIIFLAELLGILDRDPQPVFSSTVYTDTDMFGGREQRWGIRTRHVRLRREIEQAINESWQSVNVTDDSVVIRGLPDGTFIDWDGDLGFEMELKVGNVPADMEEPILSLARSLFKKVECTGSAGSSYQKVRASLRQEYRNGESSAEVDGAGEDLAHVVAALMDDDSDTSLAALNRLVRTNRLDEPGVRVGVLRALAEGNNLIRPAIAEALGRSGNKENVKYLVTALQDGNSTVRENALLALGKLGDKTAMPAVVARLEDRMDKVRWYALVAINDLVSDREWPAVADQVVARLEDDSHYVRGVAISMVADRADTSLLQPLLDRLEDNSDWVRREAIRGLRKLRDPRSVPGLIAALGDRENAVRGLAAGALAELNDRRAVKPLREALAWVGEDEELRKDLTSALDALGQKPGRPAP